MLWLIVGGLGLALAPLLDLPHTGPGPMIRVRDWWLLGLLAVAFAWTLEHAVIFAPMAAWFLIRWRGVDVLPSLVTWGGIAATWELARALPVEFVRLLPWAWVAIGCVLSAMIIVQRWWGKDQRTRGEPFGWLAQRTLASAWLALILPFAPWWLWPLIGTAFVLTGPSWIAAGALYAGSWVMSPTVAFIVTVTSVPVLSLCSLYGNHRRRIANAANLRSHVWDVSPEEVAISLGTASESVYMRPLPHGERQAVVESRARQAGEDASRTTSYERGGVVEEWFRGLGWCVQWKPRGDTIDGLWQRLNKYRLIVTNLTLAGHGPSTLNRQILRWNTLASTPAQREPLALGESAHNEYLEHVWSFGALGGLTIVLALWDVGSRLRLHDPWSASAVTAAVVCLGTFPLRVAPIGLTMLAIWASVAR